MELPMLRDKNMNGRRSIISARKKNFWPKTGKHILAQYDDETVVVYQAYKPSIAEYAVKNQRWD